MNIQEFIKRIEKLPVTEGPIADTVTVNREWILKSIEQLDELQKPVVPQFVADYIDFKKTYDFHVYGAMREIENHYDKRVPEWFYENNIETFVRAWLDGYEVEEEKKFAVKLTKTQQYLYCIDNDFTFVTYVRPDDNPRLYHTRKELEEAGFGDVFNSPLFEIEEVEE
nr:MAG: Protein of unknown function (DUF1642) [Bacteriophage sp.]